MGLFQHKQQPLPSPDDVAAATEQHFLDENFREELRNHGRLYFEKIINENGDLFKKDLDATITALNAQIKENTTQQLDATIEQVGIDLKEHVTQQLNAQFADYTAAAKESQDAALKSLQQSVQSVQEKHQQLSVALQADVAKLQKSVSDQEAMMSNVIQGNMTRIIATKEAQDSAIQSLNKTVQALEAQQEQLGDVLQKQLATQESMMISVFEDNMARIIEHYLLGALGDQFDMKAQLPSIIQQLETNKQAIVDDMKL